jgi:hypothetical protein
VLGVSELFVAGGVVCAVAAAASTLAVLSATRSAVAAAEDSRGAPPRPA